ncbi:hypothetical protein ABTN45_20180, partial [Acinetobacter baumannii]
GIVGMDDDGGDGGHGFISVGRSCNSPWIWRSGLDQDQAGFPAVDLGSPDDKARLSTDHTPPTDRGRRPDGLRRMGRRRIAGAC